jgi:cytidylate kinase
MLHPVICLDGPAASGKSTVARLVARDLGYVYVDTGAMYRAFTFLTLEAGHDPASRSRMKELLSRVDFHADIQNGEIALCEGTRDLVPHIRLPEVNAAVSIVSALPELREHLVNLQRKLRLSAPLVMEGRDIGTVVFPETPYKFYVDASAEVRAARRAGQGLEDSVNQRDAMDKARKESPLLIAPDAQRIDTSHMSLSEVVDEIFSRLQAAGIRPPTA